MNDALTSLKPTERFTNRAGNYAKYRPGYPEEVIALLRDKFSAGGQLVVADIGSGTGIFSELLLKAGWAVYGVEPNQAMRTEAGSKLAGYSGFTSLTGTAEQTNLPPGSVNLVTVAQAFHWFNAAMAKTEFMRILKPGGGVMLAWNLRVNNTPLMVEYEQLKIDFGTDYTATKRADENTIREFYQGWPLHKYTFPNNQLLDFESLKGQLLSASYIPCEGSEGYNEMIAGLERIFARYNKNGFVEISQETVVYLNR